MLKTNTKQYRLFLEKLKQARLDAGLNQSAVAKKLGKPQQFVSRCETGQTRVDVVDIQAFAKLYKKPFDFFLS